MNKPIILNLFGEPGCGKSTSAANVFAYLKNQGCNVELVREYVKDIVYEGSTSKLRNQLYITAKQYKKMKDVADYGVKLLITDSPLLLGKIYSKHLGYYATYSKLIDELVEEFENVNVFVKRVKPYQKVGRYQTEEEARKLSGEIKSLVSFYYRSIFGDNAGQTALAEDILKDFGSRIKYE